MTLPPPHPPPPKQRFRNAPEGKLGRRRGSPAAAVRVAPAFVPRQPGGLVRRDPGCAPAGAGQSAGAAGLSPGRGQQRERRSRGGPRRPSPSVRPSPPPPGSRPPLAGKSPAALPGRPAPRAAGTARLHPGRAGPQAPRGSPPRAPAGEPPHRDAGDALLALVRHLPAALRPCLSVCVSVRGSVPACARPCVRARPPPLPPAPPARRRPGAALPALQTKPARRGKERSGDHPPTPPYAGRSRSPHRPRGPGGGTGCAAPARSRCRPGAALQPRTGARGVAGAGSSCAPRRISDRSPPPPSAPPPRLGPSPASSRSAGRSPDPLPGAGLPRIGGDGRGREGTGSPLALPGGSRPGRLRPGLRDPRAEKGRRARAAATPRGGLRAPGRGWRPPRPAGWLRACPGGRGVQGRGGGVGRPRLPAQPALTCGQPSGSSAGGAAAGARRCPPWGVPGPEPPSEAKSSVLLSKASSTLQNMPPLFCRGRGLPAPSPAKQAGSDSSRCPDMGSGGGGAATRAAPGAPGAGAGVRPPRSAAGSPWGEEQSALKAAQGPTAPRPARP